MESVLPFPSHSSSGRSRLVRGIDLTTFEVPLHRVMLYSKSVEEELELGIRPALHVYDVHVILGNNYARGRVWQSNPVVSSSPQLRNETDDCSKQFPDMFAACAVTRSATRAVAEAKQVKLAAEKTRFALPDFPLNLSYGDLVKEQLADQSLCSFFECTVPADTFESMAHGYCIKNCLLVRKWTPSTDTSMGEPWLQVVVPATARCAVMKTAHDMLGHSGVRKTYDRIMHSFFWLKLRTWLHT